MIKKKFHYEMAKARSRRISRPISRRKDILPVQAWEYLGELSCRRAGRSSDGSVTTQLQRSELSSPADIITGACSPRMRCHTLRARRAISPRRDIRRACMAPAAQVRTAVAGATSQAHEAEMLKLDLRPDDDGMMSEQSRV